MAGAGSWYLSKEEIERVSPSRRDGVGAAKEAEIRGTYCSFMRDVGVRLQLPQITVATAIMLCHRFYLYQSHARNEWQTIATVCIFLASKIEDTPCPLQRVVVVAYQMMYRRDPDATRRISQKDLLEKRKALILLGESLLLSTIRFDFNIQHPYEPLKLALKNLGIFQKEVKQVAINLINDSLWTTLVVQFKPQYIAAGSLFVAAKFHNLKLPSENGKVWWNHFEVGPKQLHDVILQMTELFMRRNKCSTGPGIKPTPVPAPAPPAPAPAPLEKEQIINIPKPVLRFTYSRRRPIMSDPTQAPTVVKKQQMISTTDPVPAPTAVKKHPIAGTPDPVPAPTVLKKQQIASTPDPVPDPTPVMKQQIISTPDAVSALTTVREQQSRTPTSDPTAVKRHQITSIQDPVLRHTHTSRTSVMSSNHDGEAGRYMPLYSSSHQNSVSSARNGDHKSVRTHMNQGLSRNAMHGRSQTQPSQAAPKGDHSLENTGMDGGLSEKSSQAALEVDHNLNSSGMDRASYTHSVPKDMNATEVRTNEDDCTGRQIGSMVVETKPPSLKRQKF